MNKMNEVILGCDEGRTPNPLCPQSAPLLQFGRLVGANFAIIR